MLAHAENELQEVVASTGPWADGFAISEWIAIGIGLVLMLLARGAMLDRNMAGFIATVAKEATLFSRIAAGNRGANETIGTSFVLGHRFPSQRWGWLSRARRRFRRKPSEWLRVRHYRMTLISCDTDGSADAEPLWDTGLNRREVVNRTLATYPLPKRHFTAEELPDKAPGYAGRRQPATIIEMRADDGVHAYLFVEGHWWWQRVRRTAPDASDATGANSTDG